MTEQNRDRRFMESAKDLLDRSLEDVDSHTLARLQAARRRALEPTPKRVPLFWWAGGFAAASAALFVMNLWVNQPGSLTPMPTLEDIEILAASDDLDFYEDLEFYGWLAGADVAS